MGLSAENRGQKRDFHRGAPNSRRGSLNSRRENLISRRESFGFLRENRHFLKGKHYHFAYKNEQKSGPKAHFWAKTTCDDSFFDYFGPISGVSGRPIFTAEVARDGF